MKLVYKHLKFYQGASGIWWVNNKCGENLGTVDWFVPWRQWVFNPSAGAIFSVSCMADIIHFIGQLVPLVSRA